MIHLNLMFMLIFPTLLINIYNVFKNIVLVVYNNFLGISQGLIRIRMLDNY